MFSYCHRLDRNHNFASCVQIELRLLQIGLSTVSISIAPVTQHEPKPSPSQPIGPARNPLHESGTAVGWNSRSDLHSTMASPSRFRVIFFCWGVQGKEFLSKPNYPFVKARNWTI